MGTSTGKHKKYYDVNRIQLESFPAAVISKVETNSVFSFT